MADVTFLGACGTVTGSSTLLTWGNRRVLVDCGLFQGGDEIEQRNHAPFAFDPTAIDAVIVTHAHLDHTGLLPRLTAHGFSGPIYSTRPSRPLISLVLEDAAEIQVEQASYAARKGYSRHPHPKPLYTPADARRVRELLQPVRFDETREIFPGIKIAFRRAGHLLGAASVEVAAKDGQGQRKVWGFSGDIGRYDVAILQDPQPFQEPVDALLLESTYGDRTHSTENPERQLREIAERVFERGGVLIIPSFALGRTQEVLYHLAALVRAGFLRPNQIVLDSPMAISATTLYAQFQAEHDDEFERLRLSGDDPLGDDDFVRCRTSEESKAVNRRPGPFVLVASSGMAEGGRVVHHLRQRLPDPANAVLFVGYQASGTRGRALVDGARTVGIHGVSVPVGAEVLLLSSLSAHADAGELLRWCDELPAKPRRIFLNHGEDPARKALAAALGEKGFARPVLASSGLTVPW
jgi:metallo-beta-lactamase family protein